MKKLWTVTVEAEVIVLAETKDDALREARDVSTYDHDFDYHASEMLCMPGGWDGGEIPYGSDDDKTIIELVDEGAAPVYKSTRDAAKARSDLLRVKAERLAAPTGSKETP